MEWPSVRLMWRMEVCETFGKEKPKFRVVSLCFSGVVNPISSCDCQDSELVLAYESPTRGATAYSELASLSSCTLYLSFLGTSFDLTFFCHQHNTTSLSLNFYIIMLSIKNSLASVLLLASYAAAAAPGQSAINLQVEYCSSENTGASNAQGTFILISSS